MYLFRIFFLASASKGGAHENMYFLSYLQGKNAKRMKNMFFCTELGLWRVFSQGWFKCATFLGKAQTHNL